MPRVYRHRNRIMRQRQVAQQPPVQENHYEPDASSEEECSARVLFQVNLNENLPGEEEDLLMLPFRDGVMFPFPPLSPPPYDP